VIANDTPQRIRALTLAWAWTDAAGRTTTRFTSDSDYFFSANSEVVSALSQTLVFPSGVLPGMALNASLGAELRLPARSLVEELGRAVKVTVEVDVAVFEDGRVLGPDHSRTVLNLQARDAAARAYVRRLRAAADNGEDANTVLASLAELAPPLALEGVWQDQLNASTKIGDKDLERFWIARLARAEQQTPTVAFGADRMAKTPPLPAFLRVPN
jgi:hypothetical protein